MIDQMANAGPHAIIGLAFDDFPIYGDNNPDGSVIAKGDLDVCNGLADATFGYRCHSSSEAPCIVQCLMGVVADFDRLPRVPPLVAAYGRGAAPGRAPRGGVQNLVFTEHPDESRNMDYAFEGADHFVRYTPSNTPGCYEFTTWTVTNRGQVQSGEYCR